MWDWSNSKKTVSNADAKSGTTNEQLDDLFSLDDVAVKKDDNSKEKSEEKANTEALTGNDDGKSDKNKFHAPGFGVSDFSLTKSLKSGAKEDGLSKNIAAIPPPPPSVSAPASFVRPGMTKEKEKNERKGVSDIYAGAMGLRQEVPPRGDKSMWELQFRQAGLPGMVLAEITYSPLEAEWRSDLLKGFKRIRRDFLKYIGYHNLNDLTSAGIDENGVKLLKSGRIPENFDVHIKIPLEYGGTNDFSNLCLMQTRPFHDALHKFIDMQTSNLQQGEILRSIFIPVPNGKVYIPEVEISVGGGRKMADRSAYSGFLSSTFKEIAIKSMMGKSRSID